MSTKRDKSADQLDRALDRMVEDISATSDKEILSEAIVAYGSIGGAVARVQSALKEAQKRSGKKKLEEARAELAAVKSITPFSGVTGLSIAAKRKILQRFAENDNPKLTMAARNGVPIGEAEIDGMLEDLIEIGAIDEQGNPI